jgi:hypothetical protein
VLFAPITVATFLLWKIVIDIAAWLKELISITLPAVIPITINGLELLKLKAAYEFLSGFANIPWWQVLFFAILATVMFALLTAFAWVIAGSIFNGLSFLSGGLEVTLSEKNLQPAGMPSPQVSPPQSAFPASPRLAASGARLDITSPAPQIIPLPPKPIVIIGGDPSCDIHLEGLPPRYAQISLEGGRYILRQLGHGRALVQGRPITEANMIKNGFTLQFEQWVMVFRQ